MNPKSGEFTTPVSGFYAFTFTGSTKCKGGEIEVSVLKNDEKQHSFHRTSENAYVHLSGSWMVELNQGDIVSLKTTSTSTNDALSQGTFDTLFLKSLKKYFCYIVTLLSLWVLSMLKNYNFHLKRVSNVH